MMERLQKIEHILNRFLMIIGGVAVLGLMGLATGNVVLRVFHAPFRGAYEVVSFLGAVVIACALGFTQKRKDNIVVNILTERFSKQTNRVLNTFSYFITMLFFAVVAWQVFVYAFHLWQGGEVSETLKLIYYPFVLVTGFGFAALSFTLLVDFLVTLIKGEE
jgi:TRAP-type C4-dicarboxylate transport system permease small subunit